MAPCEFCPPKFWLSAAAPEINFFNYYCFPGHKALSHGDAMFVDNMTIIACQDDKHNTKFFEY